MADESLDRLIVGHRAEWSELILVLREHRGLTVLVSDPLSGTSALLGAAAKKLSNPVCVDARCCANALDLATAIADSAIETLAPESMTWWLGTAPPSSTAGLRLSRRLAERGIDPRMLRSLEGGALTILKEAIELTAIISDGPATLVIDHLGYMLANQRALGAREVLDTLRATTRVHDNLNFVLVDHPHGVITRGLSDTHHPLYRAGERLRITRPTPDQVVADLPIGLLPMTPVALVRGAAELAAGVPGLIWQVVAMAPDSGENPARALSGWESLRRASATSVQREWELLRCVHPAAQTIVSAISLGFRPHSVPAASKTVADGLNRLRDVGIAWQPAERSWAVSDPLLAAYAREHAQPWTRRRTRGASRGAAGV